MKRKSALEYIHIILCVISGVAILVMALGSVVDIFHRAVTNSSYAWMMSLCECCMAVMVWSSIMPTQRMKGHVNVTIFTSKMSPKWQKILEVFAALVGAIFLTVLMVMSFQQGMWAYSRKMFRAGDYTRFPIWWAYLFVPFGCAMMILQLAAEVIFGIRDLIKGNYGAGTAEKKEVEP